MNLQSVGEIVTTIVISFGGASIIILNCIKYASDIIAKNLEEKYSTKLKKELEDYKSDLESKKYVTQLMFDTELEVYKILSKKFFQMVKMICILVPPGLAKYPADKKEREEYENRIYGEARSSYVAAQDALNENAPFITEEMAGKYKEILNLCMMQLTIFEERWNVGFVGIPEEKENLSYKDFMRSKDIQEKYQDLNCVVRTHLSTLNVL